MVKPEGSMEVKIPVDPKDRERFLKWINHFEMKAKKERYGDYFHVEYTNPLDLYWLGANMIGQSVISNVASNLCKPRF